MNRESSKSTAEERDLIARLRRAPAVAPSPAVRDRIVAAAATDAPRRRWIGRLAAAVIVAAVGITFLFPPAPSSAPARLAFEGAVLESGLRTNGLARLARDLEWMEREIR